MMWGANPMRKFPQRNETMYLDSIKPADVPAGHIYNVKDEDLSLTTGDIERAQPYYNSKRFTNMMKPPIEDGQRSKTFYPENPRRPRDISLTTFDIDGARPRKTKVKGVRHTDPLQPDYMLPTSQENRPPTPRRFSGRHTNDISDIAFTTSKIRIPDRNYIRDPNDCTDIPFTCPNYRSRHLRPVSTDGRIYQKGEDPDYRYRKPFRNTNPLDPEYVVSQSTTTSLNIAFEEERAMGGSAPMRPRTIGPVAGAKPRKLQWTNGEPFFSLTKEDIAGANPQRYVGEVPYNIYDSNDKKEPISFHDPFDIPGAQVGTLIKGMNTMRKTNPITPNYRLLDGQMQPVPVYNPRTGLDTQTIPLEQWQANPAPGDSAPKELNLGSSTGFKSTSGIPERSPGAEAGGGGGFNESVRTVKVDPSASAVQKMDAFMD